MNRRHLRVAELLKNVLAQAIQFDLCDPRLRGLISVTKIELSPDYAEGKVFISILGSEVDKRSSLEALRSSRGALQLAIQKNCSLRIIPRLKFFIDDTLRKEQEFNELMRKAMDGIDPESESESESAPES